MKTLFLKPALTALVAFTMSGMSTANPRASTSVDAPADVSDSMSQWHGTIEQRVYDSFDDRGRLTRARQETVLRTATGVFTLNGFAAAHRAARLSSEQPLQARRSGQAVTVTGTALADGTIAVAKVEWDEALSEDRANIVSRPITIIISVEEENDANLAKIKKTMAQVAETFNITSFGHKKINLDANGDGEPDVYGAVKVKGDPKQCREGQWSKEAEQIVKDKYGVDFSLYNHKVFVFDKRYSCRWSGLAILGCITDLPGSNCPAWMNTHKPGVILHELGHNLGMHHSMKGGQEYGDMSDPMGSGMETFFNAAHTDQMGWFDGFDGATLDIESLGGKTTTVEIHPITAPNDGKLKAIRYNHNKAGFGAAKDRYYFGLRTEEGLDAKIATSRDKDTKYLDHLNVHTIFTEAGGGKTKFITSIGDGESWRHPGGAFTLTQQPVEASKAKKILIEFN